jgi:hypothetical protein
MHALNSFLFVASLVGKSVKVTEVSLKSDHWRGYLVPMPCNPCDTHTHASVRPTHTCACLDCSTLWHSMCCVAVRFCALPSPFLCAVNMSSGGHVVGSVCTAQQLLWYCLHNRDMVMLAHTRARLCVCAAHYWLYAQYSAWLPFSKHNLCSELYPCQNTTSAIVCMQFT